MAANLPCATAANGSWSSVALGNSGLAVSGGRAGHQQLRHEARPASRAGGRRTPRWTTASRSSTPPTPTARREERLGEILAGPARRRRAGDEVRQRRAPARQRQRRGLGRARVAALRPARGRVVAAPAAHRLDRPLPAAPPGPGDADRGDAVGARRPGATRARCATSAPRTSPAGRWPTPSGPRAPAARAVRQRAEPVQLARARHRGRPRARARALRRSGCCPTSRSPAGCSPASTGAASAPPAGSRLQAWGRESALTDAAFDVVEALEAFADRAGHRPAGRRDRRPGRPAGRRQRDRRRDHARAGRGERRRRHLAAFGGRPGDAARADGLAEPRSCSDLAIWTPLDALIRTRSPRVFGYSASAPLAALAAGQRPSPARSRRSPHSRHSHAPPQPSTARRRSRCPAR